MMSYLEKATKHLSIAEGILGAKFPENLRRVQRPDWDNAQAKRAQAHVFLAQGFMDMEVLSEKDAVKEPENPFAGAGVPMRSLMEPPPDTSWAKTVEVRKEGKAKHDKEHLPSRHVIQLDSGMLVWSCPVKTCCVPIYAWDYREMLDVVSDHMEQRHRITTP